MGIGECINSTAEAVKRNAPDLTPVRDACWRTYGYGSAAVTKIDSAVRVNGLQRLYQYMADEKSRAQIGLFASKFAQNAGYYAMKEGYKMIPGGKAVAEIVSKSIHDVKMEDRSNREMEANKEIALASGKNSGTSNLLGRVGMQRKALQFDGEKGLYAKSTTHESPEEVLRNFMAVEFVGTRFLLY